MTGGVAQETEPPMHLRTQMRTSAASIGLGLLLLLPAVAHATPTPREALSRLAAFQTHSWVDDNLTVATMLERYKSGQRLRVTCGHAAEVARRLLREFGYPARVVQTLTLEDWDYRNDGHLMTEVYENGRWQLYDVDANVRAVDANGDGVSVVEQVAAVREGRALWEPIADDPLFLEDEPDEELRESARLAFSDLPALYRRLMGVALLPRDPVGAVSGGMYFREEGQETRLREYSGGASVLASPETWRALTTGTDAPAALPASVPGAPAGASPVVPAPAPTTTPAVRTPSAAGSRRCRVRGQRVNHQGVSCRAAKRALRRYLQKGDGGRWECRGTRRVVCRRRAARASVRLAAR